MQSSALSAPIRNCPTNQHSVSKHHLTCWNSPSQYLEICFINLSGTALNPDRHGRRCLKYLRSYWLRRRTSVSVFPVASQSKPAGSIPVTIRRTNRSIQRQGLLVTKDPARRNSSCNTDRNFGSSPVTERSRDTCCGVHYEGVQKGRKRETKSRRPIDWPGSAVLLSKTGFPLAGEIEACYCSANG